MLEIAFLILILVSMWVGLYQVVKQQGRIILRLDELEKRSDAASEETKQPAGLPVGTPFPAFTLPDLAGKQIALDDFRGNRVLLVHWNPQCGFCDMLAPDLASLQPDFEKRGVQLLLLAQGDVEANRKLAEDHGLRCPVLLLKDRETPEPFKHQGTPIAYLLDAEGRIMKPLAQGSEQVPALAEEALDEDPAVGGPEAPGPKDLPGKKPLSASKIVREGLKAGTPAPAFHLPDIYGKTVSLDDYRGRAVLLVFSDPHCGPCDQLAPQLARFDRKHSNNGLSLMIIGRGEPEENRKKAEQHGIKFPFVIQERWRLSKKYGIFSTPVAFLVDSDGVIARDVAIGPDPILELAEEGLRLGKGKGKTL